MWVEKEKWLMETEMSIDGEPWHPELTGPTQDESPTAKHAQIGDTIRWEIHNTTSMAHPWHLHGFSFQPIEFLRHDTEGDGHGAEEEGEEEEPETFTRWSVDHDEFVDTVLIPPHTSVIYLVKIEDPNADGGAAGRWLKHCHIFQHGEDGMMSELIVSP